MNLFKNLKLLAALTAGVLLSYLYILNGDFLGDDIDRIVLNPELRSYWLALTGGLSDRPLVMILVTSICKLFGKEIIVFRLVNIILHSLVSYQIYLFVLELNNKSENVLKNQIAIFSAFIFALHPLNNQAISTSIQVGVLLSGLFGLLSLRYFFLGFDNTKNLNYLKSIFYFLLGILSKPNLVFIPLIFIFNRKKIQDTTVNRIKYFIPYFAFCLIPVLFYFFFAKNVQHNKYTPLTYFLVESEVLFTYFKLFIFPHGLKFLYDFNVPENNLFTLNWLYVFGHLAIVLFAYFKLPSRLLWTIFLCFYLSFIPESSFFPINHFAFEHRTYFPLIFFSIFIGTWMIHLDLNITFKRLIIIATFAISAFYIVLNQGRNVEIKRWGTWAAHTLNHSITHEYNNFSLSYLLARSKNFELLEPIAQKYLILFPDRNYDVVIDFIGYHKNPEKREFYLDKFLNHLENPNLNFTARVLVIKMVFEDFAQKTMSLPELVKIEIGLSNQLKFLFGHGNILLAAGRQAYAGMANFLLNGPLKDRFKTEYPVNFLKVKVLCHLYYHRKFDHLEEDVALALKNDPANEILRNLAKALAGKKD